ncbi:hypothetical protein E4U26_003785 [Claviceps purpurea]|nr:hypothetical protein E4U26_003785 [Claviceps purpurea]
MEPRPFWDDHLLWDRAEPSLKFRISEPSVLSQEPYQPIASPSVSDKPEFRPFWNEEFCRASDIRSIIVEDDDFDDFVIAVSILLRSRCLDSDGQRTPDTRCRTGYSIVAAQLQCVLALAGGVGHYIEALGRREALEKHLALRQLAATMHLSQYFVVKDTHFPNHSDR